VGYRRPLAAWDGGGGGDAAAVPLVDVAQRQAAAG
jgi:hypothetical protein